MDIRMPWFPLCSPWKLAPVVLFVTAGSLMMMVPVFLWRSINTYCSASKWTAMHLYRQSILDSFLFHSVARDGCRYSELVGGQNAKSRKLSRCRHQRKPAGNAHLSLNQLALLLPSLRRSYLCISWCKRRCTAPVYSSSSCRHDQRRFKIAGLMDVRTHRW